MNVKNETLKNVGSVPQGGTHTWWRVIRRVNEVVGFITTQNTAIIKHKKTPKFKPNKYEKKRVKSLWDLVRVDYKAF